MSRTIGWFSGGVASAVVCKLMLDTPGLVIVNCDMRGSEDEDNERFLKDCERWYGREIIRIKSVEYDTIDDVFEAKRYLAGINGSPCTTAMKFLPRMNYQLPSDTHLWGYTADKRDRKRYENMVGEYPQMLQRSPLIERGLTKGHCFALLEGAGIKRPRVYDLGFPNGNCPGCVKSTSPDYWSLVRKEFPEVFARRCDQSRRFGKNGVRLVELKGERIFLDELPADWPTLNPISPSCDFLCHFARQDMGEAASPKAKGHPDILDEIERVR